MENLEPIEWSSVDLRFQLTVELLEALDALGERKDLSRGSIARRALAKRLRLVNVRDFPREQDLQLDRKFPSRVERAEFTKRGILWSGRRMRVGVPRPWVDQLYDAAARLDISPAHYIRDSVHDYLGVPRLPGSIGLEQRPGRGKTPGWKVRKWQSQRKKK